MADFMGYENGINMSVQLSNRGHWKRFPTKVFEDEQKLNLGFLVNDDYGKSVRFCEEGYPLSPVSGCIFEIEKCYMSWEHEQGYGSICSIDEDQRGWIKRH